MFAAMAVELFIWIYAIAFGLSAVIAIALLVAAARRIGKEKEEK